MTPRHEWDASTEILDILLTTSREDMGSLEKQYRSGDSGVVCMEHCRLMHAYATAFLADSAATDKYLAACTAEAGTERAVKAAAKARLALLAAYRAVESHIASHGCGTRTENPRDAGLLQFAAESVERRFYSARYAVAEAGASSGSNTNRS